jgi:hypothetical protein
MTEEEKKRIVSEPPPPTDEIDGEWGDDDQTLVREVPEGVSQSQPAPPSDAVSATAAAPISVPAKATEPIAPKDDEDEDEDEEDEEDEEEDEENASEDEENASEDEEDEEEEDEEAAAKPPHPAPATSVSEWLPDWAPYAVLALLVSVSILVGLGLVGGGPAAASAESDKAAEPAAKPSPHP